jgi:hypothetical protein
VQPASCTAKDTDTHPYQLANAAPLIYGVHNNAVQYPTTFYVIVFGNSGVVPCTVFDDRMLLHGRRGFAGTRSGDRLLWKTFFARAQRFAPVGD